MTHPIIEEVQARLSALPDHVIHVDLLVFRGFEMKTPTSWQTLCEWAVELLEAVQRLRAHRLDSVAGNWARAPLAVFNDPPVFHLGAARFDTLTEEDLLGAQRWAVERARDRPPCRDPAREQMAVIVEERLFDVLLEAAYALRRQRRHPRLPPEMNPLLPHIETARRALREDVRFELERLARHIGPFS